MDNWNRRRPVKQDSPAGRIAPFIIFGAIAVFIFGIMANSCSNDARSWENSSVSWSGSSSSSASSSSYANAQPQQAPSTVPWDYRLVEGTVGDLIGGDMTLLPGNELLPNDDNYGTGDKVWALEYMEAVMKTTDNNRNDIRLTSWKPIKSYRTKQAAEQDIAKLKVSLKTEIDLVGVYKTTYQGKEREFAVLTLPSGQTIKQPIDKERYAKLKPLKKANVILEEVHDYSNYDMAYAKFRGWAS
ncbi:hypothetical protein [Paenibacillus beijingensis]|uniref:Gram-positive signal peptide protein, YSIRK family n=1 Tax=Paenibacillus beijingensis TaxID=1126833 RepID=A0A0D5NG23_9BACL|nr:hypothetical protein [Paenibacillus beijingensis]AJY73863.1 Gram-positive signal peptide protein, YSIRK family [Paenibacillus beijingensis]